MTESPELARTRDRRLTGKGVGSILRNTAYLLGGRGINTAVRFVYALILARHFGPQLYGILGYGISWYMVFLPVTSLGFSVILAREAGLSKEMGARAVATTLTLRLFSGVLASMACGVTGWIWEGDPLARQLLVIFAIALFGRSFALWTEQVFTAYESNKGYFHQQGIFRPLEVVFGLGILFAGGGVVAVAIVHMLSWWLQALWGFRLVDRRLTPVRMDWAWQPMKTLLGQGIPIGLSAILNVWLVQGPLILFRHTAAEGDSLGEFALVIQVFSILTTVPGSAAAAALPVLSRSVRREDGKDRDFLETFVRAAWFFWGGLGLVAMGSGPWLVHLVLGQRFGGTGLLLGPVVFLLIPWTCGSALLSVYMAKGKFLSATLVSGFATFVLTLSLPPLIASHGAMGAILGMGLTMSIWTLALVVASGAAHELDLGAVLFRPGAAMILSLGIYFGLRAEGAWLALSMSLLSMLVACFAFPLVTPDERAALAKWLRRVLPG